MKTTSWDANVFLCLIEWGLPEDVVKGMLKVVKKVHEDFSLGEDIVFWISNSPTLVHVSHPTLGKCMKFYIPNDIDTGLSRINNFRLRRANTIEFKQEWRLRSIEERQKKVIDWCKFGSEQEQNRHQKRLENSVPRVAGETRAEWIQKSSKRMGKYTKNLWRTWEACASSYYYVCWDRRVYVSQWYEGIHPGRFFLFYK